MDNPGQGAKFMSRQLKMPLTEAGNDYLPSPGFKRGEVKLYALDKATVLDTPKVTSNSNPGLKKGVRYPSSDGRPMGETSLHANVMVLIHDNLRDLFPNDFLGLDLFWFPVEGSSEKLAPDVFIVLGVPYHQPKSYYQWENGNTPPHVVFEVLSKGNRPAEMKKKLEFYQRYGVQEYYIFDPLKETLQGYLRDRTTNQLAEISADALHGWQSPLLKIWFRREQQKWLFCLPNGAPFRPRKEVVEFGEAQRQRAKAAEAREAAALQQAEIERQQREAAEAREAAALQQAEIERQQRQIERQQREAAEAREAAERQHREAAEAQLAAMAAKLRAMGLNPDDILKS
jgi:Uma2 family endonuclease